MQCSLQCQNNYKAHLITTKSMNKIFSSVFSIAALVTSCSAQQITKEIKHTPELIIETICESENGIFHYYRSYKGSSLQPDTELIDQNYDGTFDYLRQNGQWSQLITNNTPELFKKGRIVTKVNCQELFDPLGTPMKKYWESSFYTSDHP